MPTTTQTSGTAARRLLALALGLWLSGAGCLVCCEGDARAAAHGRGEKSGPAAARELLAPIREAERAAPAAVSADHSCCKARVGARARAEAEEVEEAEEAKAVEVDDATGAPAEVSEAAGPTGPEARRQTVPGRASCCRRVLQTAEQARKARVEPAPAHAPSTPAPAAHASPPRRHSFALALARAPDRGSTYLLCRTLLI